MPVHRAVALTGAVLSLVAVIIGCSAPGPAASVGFVSVRTLDAGDGGVVAWGTFFGVAAGLPTSFRDDPYAAVLGGCEVAAAGEVARILDVPLHTHVRTPYDAGAALTLRTADGATFATLPRRVDSSDAGEIISYVTPVPVPGPAPESLTLVVPGGRFPRFVGVEIPLAPDFDLLAPQGEERATITASTRFEWESAGRTPAVVVLSISSEDGADAVRCFAADDGSFVLPAATIDVLGPDFVGRLEAVGRALYRVHHDAVEDATLVVAGTSVREFVYLPPLPTRLH